MTSMTISSIKVQQVALYVRLKAHSTGGKLLRVIDLRADHDKLNRNRPPKENYLLLTIITCQGRTQPSISLMEA